MTFICGQVSVTLYLSLYSILMIYPAQTRYSDARSVMDLKVMFLLLEGNEID